VFHPIPTLVKPEMMKLGRHYFLRQFDKFLKNNIYLQESKQKFGTYHDLFRDTWLIEENNTNQHPAQDKNGKITFKTFFRKVSLITPLSLVAPLARHKCRVDVSPPKPMDMMDGQSVNSRSIFEI